MIDEQLKRLFIQERQLQIKLKTIHTKIACHCEDLDEQVIQHSKSEATPDRVEWTRWITARLEQQHTEREDQDKVGNNAHVYILYHLDEIVYIGSTNNVKSRIRAHKQSDKVFDKHKIFKSFDNRYDALKEEHRLIDKHQPKYNDLKSWI